MVITPVHVHTTNNVTQIRGTTANRPVVLKTWQSNIFCSGGGGCGDSGRRTSFRGRGGTSLRGGGGSGRRTSFRGRDGSGRGGTSFRS